MKVFRVDGTGSTAVQEMSEHEYLPYGLIIANCAGCGP